MQLVSRARSFGPRKSQFSRNGAAVVEAALLSTFLMFLLAATIDIGQFTNTVQIVRNACRECSRVASRDETSSTSEVFDSLTDYIQRTFPKIDSASLKNATKITIRDQNGAVISTGKMDQIQSGESFSIHIQFDFYAVRWLPVVNVFKMRFAEVETFGRRE